MFRKEEAFEHLLAKKSRGTLKIYLGYAAGVGKTYGMLSEGNRLKILGLDVVVGYLETHNRKETLAQIKELEILPRRSIPYLNSSVEEMSLEAITQRAPQVVIIDELAHTNAPGCENEKRWQDVEAILEKNINVITALNIQHIESVAEQITRLTGIPIQERVPDSVLQMADAIVNIDVTVEDLRERLRAGKIYEKEMISRALSGFFTESNLSLLREYTFKEAASDIYRRIRTKQSNLEPVKEVQENVMLALSSQTPNAKTLINKSIKFANQLSSRCFVVYVQTEKENATRVDPVLLRKISGYQSYARSLGATDTTLKSNDIVGSLANFAYENGIHHVIFGKSRRSPIFERIFGSVINNFVEDSFGIDVHIISSLEIPSTNETLNTKKREAF